MRLSKLRIAVLGALAMVTPLAASQDQAPADTASFQRRITPEVLVVREASPAVVYIESTRPGPIMINIFNETRQLQSVSSGTGVVIDPEGFIVTNYHVVAGPMDRTQIKVQFDGSVDTNSYPAQLVSYVESEDLALLKIKGERKFPVVVLGTSSDLMIGERVIAIGNPYQQRLSVSSGIISGLHRDLEVQGTLSFANMIQTDASINAGNSGGPLLNVNGEMVGINTLINPEAQNMGFAIPVDRVKEVLIDQLFAPQWERTWLGYELAQGNDLTIARILPGSPAEEAGISVGERIVEMDGERFASREAYNKKRLLLVPGQVVKLRVQAAKAGGPAGAVEERELWLRGWKKVDGILFERLGMTTQAVSARPFQVLSVGRLQVGGPADLIGIKSNDLIDAVRVKGSGRAWSLHWPQDFARLVADLAPGAELEIDVLRDQDHNSRLDPSELFKGTLKVR